MRWIDTQQWRYRDRIVDVAWAAFSIANLVAIVSYPGWETIPFHFIWVSLTIVYGFRVWSSPTTWVVLSVVCLTTGTLIARDIFIGGQHLDEISEVPLMAAMFLAMVWHARRRLAAMQSLQQLSHDNLRLLERQRQFVADASHQLRTPITIALGHAELLSVALQVGPLVDDAHVVIDELGRLARLADRLLVLAAADDRDLPTGLEVDIGSLIVDVAQRWQPTDRRWCLGALDEAHVIGDPDRLVLALDALIENAVHSTLPGDSIHLSVSAKMHNVAVAVRDTGTGIPADDLERIFDRFTQLERPTRRRAGSGLGLSIVQAVAMAHGGHVSVTSQLGLGTTFTVFLPTAAKAAALPLTNQVNADAR